MVIRININEDSKHSGMWKYHMPDTNLSEDQELIIISELAIPWMQQHHLFLETKFWRALRKEVLKRDTFSCVLCGSTVQLHVDHINYPGHGKETVDDLQTLCYFCHDKKTTKVDLRAMRPIETKNVTLTDDTELFTLLRGKK